MTATASTTTPAPTSLTATLTPTEVPMGPTEVRLSCGEQVLVATGLRLGAVADVELAGDLRPVD